MLLPLLIVVVSMVLAHETGHVLITRFLGGRWLGIEFRGYMLGVRLSVKSLSLRQIAWTLIAGPLAEGIVVAIANLIWTADTRGFLLL